MYAPGFSRSWSSLAVRTFVSTHLTILLFYRPHHVCSAQALHAARASGEGAQALPQAMHALDHPIKRVLAQRAIGVALAPRRGRRLRSLR